MIELHGALREVRCNDCGAFEDRDTLQRRLAELNPGFGAGDATLRPDGDMEIDAALAASFRIAPCVACGGTIRPNPDTSSDKPPMNSGE